jgi:hypothetical protein
VGPAGARAPVPARSRQPVPAWCAASVVSCLAVRSRSCGGRPGRAALDLVEGRQGRPSDLPDRSKRKDRIGLGTARRGLELCPSTAPTELATFLDDPDRAADPHGHPQSRAPRPSSTPPTRSPPSAPATPKPATSSSPRPDRWGRAHIGGGTAFRFRCPQECGALPAEDRGAVGVLVLVCGPW